MTLKFANSRLEAADRVLQELRDGKWHIGFAIGLEKNGVAKWLLRTRFVERKPAPPITSGRKRTGRRPVYEYRLTEAGQVLAEVFARLRGDGS